MRDWVNRINLIEKSSKILIFAVLIFWFWQTLYLLKTEICVLVSCPGKIVKMNRTKHFEQTNISSSERIKGLSNAALCKNIYRMIS